MKIEIPDNATNGDVIKMIFPNGKEIGYRPVKFNDNCAILFTQKWWNAKYKMSDEEK